MTNLLSIVDREEYFFDFKDGNGPVPAHQHYNDPRLWDHLPNFSEEGGWVANSATVDGSVYVDAGVTVCGNAVVYPYVELHNFVRVRDNAIVGHPDGNGVTGNCVLWDSVSVSGDAWVAGFCDGRMSINRQYDYYVVCGGCYDHQWKATRLHLIPNDAEVFYYGD